MIKPCLWTLLGAFLFAAVTSHFFGEITPEAWTIAAGICTSNGDLAWSVAMLVAGLAFIIAKRPRSPRAPEKAATMRKRASGMISRLAAQSVRLDKHLTTDRTRRATG